MQSTWRRALMLALLAAALSGCDSVLSLLFDPWQRVILADKPVRLDTTPQHFSPRERLTIKGKTTALCATLVVDARMPDVTKDGTVISAEVNELKGGAQLFAVLHARDGKDYEWKRDTWSFSIDQPHTDRGTMDTCLTWEHAKAPPVGTEIASIDLGADRPLNVLRVHWRSTDAFDFPAQNSR